ncbi:MAG TPA: redoxin family protein [Flavobacterium sp.]|nr:redoxin family protein [Flavobacterium sp.]
MKKLVFLPLAIALVALISCDSNEPIVETNPLPIGSKIPKPEVKMKDISGKEVTLKEAFKENGLLVMFSCNTCPAVKANQGRTREISKYALEKNVGIILLNSNEGQRDDEDSFEAMKDYAKKQGYNWFYAVDQNSVLADAFGANRTPECFLFNKEESLVYYGAIDDNPKDAENIKRAHLKEAINEMLNGKEVTVKTSRSVGCGIKRQS